MCLAKICTSDNTQEFLADSITSLRQTPEEVIVTTLFGEEKAIKGHVLTIDFTDSVITVEKP